MAITEIRERETKEADGVGLHISGLCGTCSV